VGRIRADYKAEDFFVVGDLVVSIPRLGDVNSRYVSPGVQTVKAMSHSSIQTSNWHWAERFALCKPDGTIIEEFPYHWWLKD